MKQNNVQLIGYVGTNPGIKICRTGIKRVSLRVATHFLAKREGNKKVYSTTWHNIVAWDHHAEFAERSFVKGSHILVNGSIIYNVWADKTGHTRYTTEIKASTLINLDR